MYFLYSIYLSLIYSIYIIKSCNFIICIFLILMLELLQFFVRQVYEIYHRPLHGGADWEILILKILLISYVCSTDEFRTDIFYLTHAAYGVFCNAVPREHAYILPQRIPPFLLLLIIHYQHSYCIVTMLLFYHFCSSMSISSLHSFFYFY